MLTDTIAAISTAVGVGGISIIRISGSDAFKIIKSIFKLKNNKKLEINHNSIIFGYIMDPVNDEVIDEVLVSFFVGPKSYTAEDTVEINCHGGIIVTNKVLELVLNNGARQAEAGEFTKRAFLNGRIDLVQAEAVIDLINSNSKKMATEATKQLEGGLSDRISDVKNILVNITANIEVGNDYPEYEFEEIDKDFLIKQVDLACSKLSELYNTFDEGKIIKEGIRVALVGKPNVGKSSLLNAILLENRAIVTDIEGTTRDVIEECININGIKVILSDTAGIRDTDNKVEKIGIEKSKEAINSSSLIICLIDAIRGIDNEDMEIFDYIKNKKCIYVINKVEVVKKEQIDFLRSEISKCGASNILEMSISNKLGISVLKDKIKEMFELEKLEANDAEIVTNMRHKQLICKSLKSLNNVVSSLKSDIPLDMICIDLRDTLANLNEITGDNVSEEIIHEIFSKFCVGK